MKLKLSVVLAFFAFTTAWGQTPKLACDCPKTQMAGTKAETSFHFSTGQTIVLCGHKNPDTTPATYSEFVLAVCGQDNVIDFWSAARTCRLKINRDTLFVEQIENLPTGKNLKRQETVWTTEKMYFKGQSLNRKLTVNRQITRYNQNEIKQVLTSYETAKPGLDESKMEIASKLFIATISGSQTARQYFKAFRTKFGTLDGAFAEEYDNLTAMMALWDLKTIPAKAGRR